MRIDLMTATAIAGWLLIAVGATLFLVSYRHLDSVNLNMAGIGMMVLGLPAEAAGAARRIERRRTPRRRGRIRMPLEKVGGAASGRRRSGLPSRP